jgi:hypothetical protein
MVCSRTNWSKADAMATVCAPFLPIKGFSCHSACNIDPLSRGIGVQN